MKRVLLMTLFFLLLGYLGLVFFANRGLYFSRFDPVYWKDRYEHSQWKLPRSNRGIGDDGLYLYQGYNLIRGADPTVINAEVPPLGKYAIGTSIRLFGNGYAYGFLTTTAAIVLFFFLAKLLLRRVLPAIVVTLLVATDPLLTSQFALTMLESIQLLFFLLTALFVALCLRSSGKRIPVTYTLCAGISFGLFSATKFPLLSPLFAITIALLLWHKTKKWLPLLFFFASACAGYMASYFQYFRLGHTIVDWLAVQKWMVSFYTHANLVANVGSMATTMLSGVSQNLFTRSWQPAAVWSPSWSVLFLVFPFFTVGMWKIFRNDATGRLVLAAWVAAVLLLNVIPFWTRYLVLFLPFFYLAAISVFKTAKRVTPVLVAFVLLANAWASLRLLFPTPQASVSQFLYDWQHGFFQDMYEQIAPENTGGISRKEFHRFGQQVFYDAQIEGATIDVVRPATSRFRSPQPVTLRITYVTRNLGSFAQETTLPVVNIDGRWRIPWEWDNLIEDLSETTRLKTNVTLARRGTLINEKLAPVAQDKQSSLVWVTPQAVDTAREEEMLKLLEELFQKNVAAALLHQRYMQWQSDWPIPLGVIRAPLEKSLLARLSSYPGVTLSPAYFRWVDGRFERLVGQIANTKFSECCSFFYTTTTYDGVSGWEQQYNEALKGQNGGSLVLKNSQGNIVRTIIEKEKRDGRDVEL